MIEVHVSGLGVHFRLYMYSSNRHFIDLKFDNLGKAYVIFLRLSTFI